MSEQTEEKKKTLRRKVPALGRGLAALLGDDEYPGGSLATEPGPGEKVVDLPIERLEPNPYQPRRLFDPDSLKALSDSIAEHGVLQPLVVRPVDGGYQLIAGERRLRASQLAGLTSVPVVVRRATDQQALLLALLENLQREDLNPLEEAHAYHRLAGDFQLGQDEIARAVGARPLHRGQLPAPAQTAGRAAKGPSHRPPQRRSRPGPAVPGKRGGHARRPRRDRGQGDCRCAPPRPW